MVVASRQETDPQSSSVTRATWFHYAYDDVSTSFDPSTTTSATYSYDAPTATKDLPSTPFRFSTKYLDQETGMGYWGYRYYHPGLGRWINHDPIGEGGGIHLYAFLRNAPTVHVDKLGHYSTDLSPADAEGMPFVYADLGPGVLGEMGGERAVKCKCDKKCGLTCRIVLDLTITIDDRFDGEGKDDDVGGHTKAGVYGHEQRHVTSFIAAVTARDPEWVFSDIESYEKAYDSLDECEMKASTCSTIYSAYLIAVVFPGHDTSRGGPADGTDYPPLGGVFPPEP